MRLRPLPLGLAAALAGIALASAGPASAKSCTPAKYPGDGSFTSLSVRGTSCAAGRTLQRRRYTCRVRNGGADGRCNRRVDGYSCSERRTRISTEINGRVSCRKGSRRVTFSYQQNL
jgi:hypothetical protein